MGCYTTWKRLVLHRSESYVVSLKSEETRFSENSKLTCVSKRRNSPEGSHLNRKVILMLPN